MTDLSRNKNVQEGRILKEYQPLTYCRISYCNCKKFEYEPGEHPGVCLCNHFDSNHQDPEDTPE